jgi:hypothetical protein
MVRPVTVSQREPRSGGRGRAASLARRAGAHRLGQGRSGADRWAPL